MLSGVEELPLLSALHGLLALCLHSIVKIIVHMLQSRNHRILYNLYIRILEVDNTQQINIIHVIIHTISKMLCLHFRERA